MSHIFKSLPLSFYILEKCKFHILPYNYVYMMKKGLIYVYTVYYVEVYTLNLGVTCLRCPTQEQMNQALLFSFLFLC